MNGPRFFPASWKRATLAFVLVFPSILSASIQADTAVLFRDSGQRLGASSSVAVGLGDLDGDGDVDAFVANNGVILSGANKVWLNDGKGVFTDSGQNLGDDDSWDVVLIDLDRDDDLDAFVANSGVNTRNKIWFNNGQGVFTASAQKFPSFMDTQALALGDLDWDNDPDVFFANGEAAANFGDNQVWLNDRDGVFLNTEQGLGGRFSIDVALADLNGDNKLDAFILEPPGASVMFNNGSGVFITPGHHFGALASTGVALNDLDRDGDVDAFVVNGSKFGALIPNTDQVWLNNGGGYFSNSGQKLGNILSQDVALGDLDEDGDADAFVVAGITESLTGENRIWLNDGDGVFSDTGLRLGSSFSWAVALADLDGDGDLDAFVANDQANTVWRNDTGFVPGPATVESRTWMLYR